MRGYVANTDQQWFEFLRQQPQLEEVNFWNPSDFYLFRGRVGSPFFFRLKSPINMIGGFGLVSWADRMPEWLAWECFGQGNGAPTLEVLRTRIRRLRDRSKIGKRPALDQIGCIVLSQPVFLPPDLWVEQPKDWKKANLRYEGYDLTVGEGRRIWEQCVARATQIAAPLVGTVEPAIAAERYGSSVTIHPRLGQGVFRLAVTDAYGRSCAVTHEHSLPALEAAHIKPYADGGEHEVRNGLLLRSDLHRLFDRGYVTVTPNHQFEVSPLLKKHFSNGHSYYPFRGDTIGLPMKEAQRPDPELLRWHNESVFRA